MKLQGKRMSIMTISIVITLPIAVLFYFVLFRPLVAPTMYDWATTAFLKSTREQLCDKATFDRYKTPDVYIGPVASLNVGSDPTMQKFKTTIRKGIGVGTNFAGHYAIASWGCGTSCQRHAIIDISTGNGIVTDLESTYGLEQYATSSLLVVNPQKYAPDDIAEIPQGIQEEYYVLKNGELTLLCKKNFKMGIDK